VPSFYGLEALRAASGRLPASMSSRRAAGTRPAAGSAGPPAASRGRDRRAEYDLALLAGLRERRPGDHRRSARYLLDANVHLGRGLRARRPALAPALDPGRRARRPGRARPRGASRIISSGRAPSRRPPSSTSPPVRTASSCRRSCGSSRARSRWRSRCSTRSLLRALPRGPVRRPERAARRGAPPGPAREPRRGARGGRWRARHGGRALGREALAGDRPGVEDGIDGIRADLREWLRRAADADDGWSRGASSCPSGSPTATARRPIRRASRSGAVNRRSPPARLRIEPGRAPPARVLRATDHKTGKTRPKTGVVVGAERCCSRCCMRSPASVYCASRSKRDGSTTAPPTAATRSASCRSTRGASGCGRGRRDHRTRARRGLSAAMPNRGACRYCDYRPVCGPHEETRTARKPKDRCADLERLRRLRDAPRRPGGARSHPRRPRHDARGRAASGTGKDDRAG